MGKKTTPRLPDNVWDEIPNRDFQPKFPKEGFNFMVGRFDVAAAWKLISNKTPEERRECFVSTRLPKRTLAMIGIDTKRAMSDEIDITVPLLIAQVGPQETDTLVIDGWHRIYKAVKLGYKELPGFRLTEAETKQIRVR